MQEMWVSDLGWEDPLGEIAASSTLPWKSPTDRGAYGATVHKVAKVEHIKIDLTHTHYAQLSNEKKKLV